MIETMALRRSFGQTAAVDGIDLRVPAGSVYAFLGPNGAGKTTTIRLLLSLLRPDSGEVRLHGVPLTRATRRHALRRVGALVEAPSLYPHLTGRENLQTKQLLVRLPAQSVEEALALVGLQRDAHRLVNTYSLGMRQRLGIGMALLGAPDLLILDEPTNGLDPAGIHEVRDLLRRLPAERGVTVFLSSHLLGEVELVATHVGIVGRGKLLFQGTLDAFQRQRPMRTVVEVDRAERAAEALAQAGWPADAVRVLDEKRLVLAVGSPEQAADAAATLTSAGLRLYQLRVERPSLEELFLDLTAGRGLPAGE